MGMLNEKVIYLAIFCVELLIWEFNCQSYALQKGKREFYPCKVVQEDQQNSVVNRIKYCCQS